MKIKKAVSIDAIESQILNTLQKSALPITTDQIRNKLDIDISDRILAICLKSLTRAGYDIKTIQHGRETRYMLVRFADFSQKNYYRVLGEVKTPLIYSSDWHVGSKGFSELAIKELIYCTKHFKVKDILIPGDINQALGVYRIEMADLLEPDIDSQRKMTVDYLRQFPKGVNFHAVIGNHEEKLKGSYRIGYDLVEHISELVDNFTYYGHVAKLLINKKYTTLMIHGSGGGTYSISYPVQKIWRSLIEYPTILAMGHLHQLEILPIPPNRCAFQCGSLQRESSYLINKGITAQVGWLVIKDIQDTKIDSEIIRPAVF